MHRANARAVRVADERRRADEVSAHLAAIVTSSSDAIISKTPQGTITSWNDGARKMFGYTAEEMIGQRIHRLIPRESLEEEDYILARIGAGERVEHYETERLRKDGSRINVSLTISPIMNSAGAIIGASKIARDITQRKQTDCWLRESMRQQEALYTFVDRLHRSAKLSEVYEAALDAIVQALACDRASILVFDEAGVMRFVASRGLSDEYRQADEGHTPWARDSLNPQLVSIEDIETADVEDSLKAAVRKEGMRSLYFIPLVYGSQLIGKFMAYYNQPHASTQEEIILALSIARQLAFGVSRKHTEAALRENEERLRLATQTGKVGIWDWDITANRVSWTDSLYPVHGVTKENFPGTVEGFASLVHPDDRQFVSKAIEASLKSGKPYELEFRALKPNGDVAWLFTNAVVFRQNDEPVRMLGATLDITEQKLVEQALRESQDRLSGLIDSAMDAVVAVDADQRIVLFNPAAEQMFGCTASEAVASSLDRFIPAHLRDGHRAHIEKFGRTGATTRRMGALGALSGIRANGNEFPIEASISHMHVAGEKLFTVILRDISQRRAAEAERETLLAREQELRLAAEEANRLKDEFLATMSHELRNPLNVILGYSELLLRTDEITKSPQLLKMADALRRNALAQSHLIRDLLDLSRLRSGKLTLNTETVALIAAITNAVETVREDAATKDIKLTIDAPDEALFVEGDILRLEQIVWNLLSNAVKFTPAGGNISVHAVKDADDVVLTVADTGQGIDPTFLPHVFEMFRQADAGTNRAQSGMGIGLALVRQLVELHGGVVSAQSVGQGQGTSFTVQFPRSAERHTTITPVLDLTKRRLSRLGVLVLDDSEDTTEMLRHLLEQGGARVITATNGAEALRIASEGDFDVVLSDISMPGMDGFEFVRRLRDLPGKKDLPVLALTGFGRPEDIHRAQSEGFFSHLTKPFDLAALSEILEKVPTRKR